MAKLNLGSAVILPAVPGDERWNLNKVKTMTDDPIALDQRRGMAAQRATDMRRRHSEVAADQAALRHRQEELEQFLLAAPATNWPEAAEKARYLITLFAETSAAQDRRRQELIASVLSDLDRLTHKAPDPKTGG
jgi:hypothetical protein